VMQWPLLGGAFLSFRSNAPVLYLCPRCWVEKGGLAPFPSDARHDLFRCGLCEYELLIPHV
jgi:hypothetical protein